MAKKLCYAKPSPLFMAVETRVCGRYLPTEGGPRTEDHYLAKGSET